MAADTMNDEKKKANTLVGETDGHHRGVMTTSTMSDEEVMAADALADARERVEGIEAELRLVLKAEAKATEKLKIIQIRQKKAASPDEEKSPFIRAPDLVRKQVYRYLLINPYFRLNEYFTYDPDEDDEDGDDFQVHVSILATCRSINVEASKIFYEQNTFLLQTCVSEKNYGYVRHFKCPLFRQLHSPWNFDIPKNEGSYDYDFPREQWSTDIMARMEWHKGVMKKVKRWEVVIGPLYAPIERDKHLINGLEQFCRNVCDVPLHSMKVFVVSQGIETDTGRNHTVSSIAAPFRILHLVENFTFAEAPEDLFPTNMRPYAGRRLPSPQQTPPSQFEPALKRIAESKEKPEYVFKMHERLVLYCKAFAGSDLEAEGMGLTSSEAARQHGKRARDPFMRPISGHTDFVGSPNPYKAFRCHPVEDGLDLASIAAGDNSVEHFKTHRAAVLAYLEPQFQRIVKASSATIEFIKDNKVDKGLFAPKKKFVADFTKGSWLADRDDGDDFWDGTEEPRNMLASYAEAFTLLEQYIKSFDRDSPAYIKVQITALADETKSWSSTEEYTIGLQRLRKLIALALRDNDSFKIRLEFAKNFREVFDNIDSRYLKMLRLRSQLFSADTKKDFRCGDFDLEKWRCDDAVDWSEEEPAIGPKNYYFAPAFYEAYPTRSRGDYRADHRPKEERV